MYIPSIHYVTVTHICITRALTKRKKRMDLLYTCTRVCIRTHKESVYACVCTDAHAETQYTYEYIYNNYIAIPKRTTATSTYEDHLKKKNTNTNEIEEMKGK